MDLIGQLIEALRYQAKHFGPELARNAYRRGLAVVAEAYRAERRSHKLDLRLPDGTQVELFSFPDPPKRLSHPEACGLRHLAFRVAELMRRYPTSN